MGGIFSRGIFRRSFFSRGIFRRSFFRRNRANTQETRQTLLTRIPPRIPPPQRQTPAPTTRRQTALSQRQIQPNKPKEKLIQAIKAGEVGQVQQLLQQNQGLRDVKDKYGNSLLHIAAELKDRNNFKNMIKALLKLGVNPMITDEYGNFVPRTNDYGDTVLHVIAQRGHGLGQSITEYNVVELLMNDVGFSYYNDFIKHRNRYNRTALEMPALPNDIREYLENLAKEQKTPPRPKRATGKQPGMSPGEGDRARIVRDPPQFSLRF